MFNQHTSTMKTTTQSKRITLLDFCLPDYFTGYHRPVLAIAVFEPMTGIELAHAMRDEIDCSWDYLTDGPNGYSEEEMKLFDEYASKIEYSTDVLGSKELGESQEPKYLYLGICELVYRYGMWFLNE